MRTNVVPTVIAGGSWIDDLSGNAAVDWAPQHRTNDAGTTLLLAALHQLPTQIPVACSIVPMFYTMKSYCRWRYGCDPIRVRLVYLSLLV
jgi:hypothetical protein